MKKVEGYIICANLVDMKNERTGEVKAFTKFEYAIEKSDSENSVGYVTRECYKQGNFLKIAKEVAMRKSILEIEEVPTKNGCKFKILKINNIEL